MASELRVNTLKDASGNNSVSTSNLEKGRAKAWANLNGTALTSATDLTGVRGSFNIASATDTTTGDHTVNLTSGFTSTDNIVFTGSCQDDDDNNKHVAGLSPVRISGGTPFTTTSVRFTTGHDANTTTLRDMDFITVVIHGEV